MTCQVLFISSLAPFFYSSPFTPWSPIVHTSQMQHWSPAKSLQQWKTQEKENRQPPPLFSQTELPQDEKLHFGVAFHHFHKNEKQKKNDPLLWSGENTFVPLRKVETPVLSSKDSSFSFPFPQKKIQTSHEEEKNNIPTFIAPALAKKQKIVTPNSHHSSWSDKLPKVIMAHEGVEGLGWKGHKKSGITAACVRGGLLEQLLTVVASARTRASLSAWREEEPVPRKSLGENCLKTGGSRTSNGRSVSEFYPTHQILMRERSVKTVIWRGQILMEKDVYEEVSVLFKVGPESNHQKKVFDVDLSFLPSTVVEEIANAEKFSPIALPSLSCVLFNARAIEIRGQRLIVALVFQLKKR